MHRLVELEDKIAERVQILSIVSLAVADELLVGPCRDMW
jgi:hypothetical protein